MKTWSSPYENSGMITAGVLLNIDRNFIFLLECTWKMVKNPLETVEIKAGNFLKIHARKLDR